MKKLLLFVFVLVSHITIHAQVLNITNVTGTYTLTCKTQTIQLIAATDQTAPAAFAWASPSNVYTGSFVSLTVPGNYTVTASTSNTTLTQYFSIVMNTVAPVSSITPTIQNISCNPSSISSFTATTPTPNTSHYIFSPYGGVFTSNSATTFYNASAVGTFTHVLIDNLNGCETHKTFTLTSSSGFPTFSITSSSNFSLGCNSNSVTSVAILNPASTPMGGSPLTFTCVGPMSPPLSPPYGVMTVFTINVPGTWTVVTMDMNNFCETRIPISIVQNTSAPVVSVNVPTQVLNCASPQVQLTATSSQPNLSYSWSIMGGPISVSNSIGVVAITATPNASIVNIYTLTVTDNISTCKSTTVIPIYQNLFAPHAVISNGGNPSITCINGVTLANLSTSGIPPSTGFPSNMPVIGFEWHSVTQPSLTSSNTYTVGIPGQYTLVAKDLNNGCTSSTVINVGMDNMPPIMYITPTVCLNGPNGIGTATLSPNITFSMSAISYSWIAPANATISGSGTSVLTTNYTGLYTVFAKHAHNGCSSLVTANVLDCSVGIDKNNAEHLAISLFPNPNKGIFTIGGIPSSSIGSIEIYNALGVLVSKQQIVKEETLIDLQNQSSGVYMIHVIENNTSVYTAKVIKH